MDQQIEKVINQVTSSDAFLRTVATLINFNSFRKIWLQNTLEKILKQLELPTRRDQERLLALVQELEIRIKKMQLQQEIGAEAKPEFSRAGLISKTAKTKKSAVKRIN